MSTNENKNNKSKSSSKKSNVKLLAIKKAQTTNELDRPKIPIKTKDKK
ncbi:MAG: hypothetical protein HS119_09920 [Flavobacteriales bacterium]|jgi:hypothetical protein|nr:hypothetical protein [Flavobacteriales bacterium]MCL4856384.1 hypothetical protein [Flavobacteriales bacterium]